MLFTAFSRIATRMLSNSKTNSKNAVSVRDSVFQLVKEPPNRQNGVFIFLESNAIVGTGHCPVLMWLDMKNPCYARHFDLLHNSNPNVPSYADGFELLVFGAPLTSVSLSKT